MDNIKNFIDSFKEFIWDIIGYFLPGSYMLILLSACVNEKYYINSTIYSTSKDNFFFVFIIVSYLLGYAIYGLGLLKEKTRRKQSYTKTIEKEIESRKSFELSKLLLSKSLHAKGINDDLSNTTLRDIRNLVMSFIPESDQKIYTFTFRADLSNHIGNISFLVGSIGLLSSIANYFITIEMFIIDKKHIIIYFLLALSYFLFRLTRNRFYAISIGLPFSIFTASSLK